VAVANAHGREGFVLTGESTPVRTLVRDIWRSRELLVVLARKEFFVRYRRTSFGLLWAVGLPLFQAVVLAVVLSHFVRFKTGVSYPVFVFSGTVAFTFFSASLTSSTGSIVDGQGISSKIYFPRAIFPLMTVLSGVYGFVLTVIILIGLELVVGVHLGLKSLLLLPAVMITVVVASAFALVLAALQVYFRDLRFMIQAALIAWFYITPVFYPLHAVGNRIGPWLKVNPATGFVELFRFATAGADKGWITSLWWSFGWSVALLVAAIALYRRFDRVFADLL
jgi:ABC-type polysaccharide/polyol phosphate export permease